MRAKRRGRKAISLPAKRRRRACRKYSISLAYNPERQWRQKGRLARSIAKSGNALEKLFSRVWIRKSREFPVSCVTREIAFRNDNQTLFASRNGRENNLFQTCKVGNTVPA